MINLELICATVFAHINLHYHVFSHLSASPSKLRVAFRWEGMDRREAVSYLPMSASPSKLRMAFRLQGMDRREAMSYLSIKWTATQQFIRDI